MKKLLRLALITIATVNAVSAADTPTSYQVTGPITKLTPTVVTVQKGKELWDLALPVDVAKAPLAVGQKVTIQYTMTAVSVEVKPDPKAKTAQPATAPATTAPSVAPKK